MRTLFLLVVIALIFVSCKTVNIDKETAIGIRQYKNDSLSEAITAFSRVISVNDTCRQCLFYRGVAYKDLKQYDKALEDFNNLISIDTSKPVGYANRASVYYLKNDYKSALRDFSIAYKFDSSKILLNPISHMLFANGYKDSACIFFQKALAFGDTTFDISIKNYCGNKNYP